jgi:lipopolysaccharide export system protein LptA
MEDQGRVLTTAHATFRFDAQQQLEQVEAKGDVVVDEQATGRHGVGARLVYSVPKKTMVLEGSPATVSDKKGTVKGKEIVFDLARNRVDVIGGTESTYKPEGADE